MDISAGGESGWDIASFYGFVFANGRYRIYEAAEDQSELQLGVGIETALLQQRLQPWVTADVNWFNDDYLPKDNRVTLTLKAGSDWFIGPEWVLASSLSWQFEDYSQEQMSLAIIGREAEGIGDHRHTLAAREDKVLSGYLTVSRWYTPEWLMRFGLNVAERLSSFDREDSRDYGFLLATEFQLGEAWELSADTAYKNLNYPHAGGEKERLDERWEVTTALSHELDSGVITLRLNREWNRSSEDANSWERSLILCEFSVLF